MAKRKDEASTRNAAAVEAAQVIEAEEATPGGPPEPAMAEASAPAPAELAPAATEQAPSVEASAETAPACEPIVAAAISPIAAEQDPPAPSRDENATAEPPRAAAAAAIRAWPPVLAPARWAMKRPSAFAAGLLFGAALGGLATTGLVRLTAPDLIAATLADGSVNDTVARLDGDIAAVQASVDKLGVSLGSELARIGDRLDRAERAQAEPGAKLAKLAEAVERVERRVASAGGPAADTTGSIAESRAASARSPAHPVVDGWLVRSVRNGAAIIEGRLGLFEIAPGDMMPGVGRIEAIKRQDGRWVVVTSRGIIIER